jgi:hypothetical protein
VICRDVVLDRRWERLTDQGLFSPLAADLSAMRHVRHRPESLWRCRLASTPSILRSALLFDDTPGTDPSLKYSDRVSLARPFEKS